MYRTLSAHFAYNFIDLMIIYLEGIHSPCYTESVYRLLSAKRQMVHVLMCNGRSLNVENENNNGPMTVPCETPVHCYC